MKERITKDLSGVAGEYFVAGELSRRGYLASITLRNTRGIDILVANADASKSAGIQVKTNQDPKKSWILTEKVEKLFSDTHFYVFVNLNHGGQPTYHVVPSKVVAETCKREHEEWLNTPGRRGQKRNQNSMRKFNDPNDVYLDRWELLNLD